MGSDGLTLEGYSFDLTIFQDLEVTSGAVSLLGFPPLLTVVSAQRGRIRLIQEAAPAIRHTGRAQAEFTTFSERAAKLHDVH